MLKDTWTMKELPFEGSEELKAYHAFSLDREELARVALVRQKACEAWRSAATEEDKKEHRSGPPSGPEKEAYDKVCKAERKVVQKRKAQADELWSKVSDEMKKAYKDAYVEHWYLNDNERDRQEEVSPCGKYTLVITTHPTGKNTWNLSRGVVISSETGEVLHEVRRNFHHFPFSWISGHRNGHDYLVCGEKYTGQTVLELDTGQRVDKDNGSNGFCWAEHYPNEDGTLLVVVGCYWGGTYQIEVFDFSNPMDPPWKVVVLYPYDTFFGWTGPSTFKYGFVKSQVNIPGHRLHGKLEDELSLEDMVEIEKLAESQGKEDEDLYIDVPVKELEWSRP